MALINLEQNFSESLFMFPIFLVASQSITSGSIVQFSWPNSESYSYYVIMFYAVFGKLLCERD